MAPKKPARSANQELMARAIEKLQDPLVRKQLLSYGRTGMKAAQQWQRQRQALAGVAGSNNDASPGFGEKVGQHFGQGRLERRVDNLRAAVTELCQDRPQLTESLDPVARAIDDVAVTLRIAGALPLVKRKRAHLKIDSVLDRLETGLFEATLGSDTGTGG
jgi:hypothetical protein